MTPVEITVLIVVGLLGLWLAFCLLALTVAGALHLFSLAVDQGFIGIAIFVAGWIFLLPVMLVLSAIAGVIAAANESSNAVMSRY